MNHQSKSMTSVNKQLTQILTKKINNGYKGAQKQIISL